MSPDDERHGTYRGALAHRTEGSERCEPCRDAYNAYMRSYRSQPDAARRTQQGNRARSRALWRLADLYRDKYEALYAEELAVERGVQP